MALPHTWRPLGVRLAGAFFGGAAGRGLRGRLVRLRRGDARKFTSFQRGTLVFLGAGRLRRRVYALVRSGVVATADRLVVVNGYKRRAYEWAEVVAVHLPPGRRGRSSTSPTAPPLSAMGIQGSDGARARRAVRCHLRASIDS